MTEHQETTKPKILIVEDEAIIAMDLQSHLEQMGYMVLAPVNSAEKALELAEQDPPDLVLMDIVLRGKMDGIEAADIIRSRWGIPVVFCTAYADQNRLERAKLVHPFGYILKPFQDQDVKVTVEMALYVSKVDRERRKAEAALRESENRYRDLVENSQDMICTHDLEGNLLSVNEAPVRALGYSPEFLLHMNPRDLLSPEQRDKFGVYLKEIQEKGRASGILRIQTASGETRYWEYNNTLRTEGLAVPIVRGMAHDITERRKAELALRESETRYRELFEKNSDPTMIFDAETHRFEDANTACLSLYGYTREEFLALTVEDISAEPDQTRALIPSIVRGDAGPFVPLRYQKKKDGSVFPSEISAGMYLAGGRRKFIGAVRDISERKQMEEIIRLSEERYRTLNAEIDEGYYEVDLAGNFTFVNDSLIRQFQYSREELIGMNYRTYTPREEVEGVYEAYNRAYRTGEIVKRYPITNIRKDGTPLFLENSISCLRDKEGRIVGFRGICRDVSERKRADDQIQASLREKEVLLREIHHRVKNNLQVIQSLLNLQAGKIKDPQALKAFKDSRDRIQSMALVHEKLYQSPNLAYIDITNYLRDLSTRLFRSSQVSPDTVKLKLEVEKVQIGIDKAISLGLILNELISNALKHAFPGGREGEIRVGIAPVDGEMIRLTVRDNGIGFPEEVDFRKAESMGLLVVTALVEQLGGTIALHREAGTEFRITFPERKK